MDDFNKLSDRDKWNKYKQMKNGKWICYRCKREMKRKPYRCDPFPGMSINCSCGAELTCRTGGGQCDPFGWVWSEAHDNDA